ncbi:MAG: tyrosine-type recombinase/integrase [Hyphomicrobiaceae bacterium]
MSRTYAKTYLVKHGKGFRYKRRVPGDLQAVLRRKVWLCYLGDTGQGYAERAARKLAVEHDGLIAKLSKMSAVDRHDFVAGGGLDAVRAAGRSDTVAPFLDPIASMDPDPTDDEVEQAQQALDILRARRDAQRLRNEASNARRLLRRLEPPPTNGVESLIPIWVARNKPRSDVTMRRHVQRFIEVARDIPAKQVTRANVAAFRDALEADERLGRPTVSKHLDSLHALFRAALSALAVDHNPAAGIKVSKAGGKFTDQSRKLPFSAPQVKVIFAAMAGEPMDTQWMLRLLAYTGARSGELAQLRVDDVTVLEGVPVIRIHDRYGPLKNKYSVRDIPIPAACIGIVEYAKSRTGLWLFEDFEAWGGRSRGATFQRNVGPFLRTKAKITDRELTLHSFRHRWRTVAREIDMPEAVSRALMGHALGAGEHGMYGAGPSLAKRAEWMAKIDPVAG